MSRKITIPGPLGLLASRIGVGKLAAEIGVSRRTISRWALGQTCPIQPVRLYVQDLLAAHGLPGAIFKGGK